MLNKGQIFDSKYEILKTLGSGGMGTVYLAQNIKLGNLWAIKEVNKKLGDRVDLLAEPNMLKKLAHPLLPRIFDIIEDENYIYIIMDYIEGIPLDKELEKHKSFTEKQVIEWANQICDALKYLHSMKPNPIIYRDMKPSNLIITPAGEVKIIDFGIAREYKQASTADTTYIGTRGYAAPEQYGTSQTDARTDIYSLGVTLYHMLTGKSPNEPPYEIKPVREINPKLSRGIEFIITKCTRQDPAQRYQSVDKLLKDIQNINKFDTEYKRKVLKKDVTIGAFIIAVMVFSTITIQGWKQLGVEKVEEYERIVAEGMEYRDSASYKEAAEAFAKAAEKLPDRPEAYKEEALVFFNQRDYDGCINYLNGKLLVIKSDLSYDGFNSTMADLDYIIGTCYYEKEEYEKAALYMKNALLKTPSNPIYYRDLSASLAKGGLIPDAQQALEEAIARGLIDDSIAYVSGEIALKSNIYKVAADSFTKAIELTKDEDVKRRAFLSLADAYKSVGDVDSQIQVLERSQNELKEKDNLTVIELLGDAYTRKGMLLEGDKREEYLKRGVECFEKLLSLGYKRSYIIRNIAILYQQMDELSKSEEALIDMKESFPDDYKAYMQLAFLYADMESRKDNASRDYTRTKQNYELAQKFYKDARARGVDDTEMQVLEGLMDELRDKNWIK
ncbi:protein kinase domain-containing protein [Lutispora sp.]|uniref:protein kinase domain-containing protein n=1 Tax=Lutispora sp. TaxID=2828727 RepID=UPI003563ED4F